MEMDFYRIDLEHINKHFCSRNSSSRHSSKKGLTHSLDRTHIIWIYWEKAITHWTPYASNRCDSTSPRCDARYSLRNVPCKRTRFHFKRNTVNHQFFIYIERPDSSSFKTIKKKQNNYTIRLFRATARSSRGIDITCNTLIPRDQLQLHSPCD